MEHERFMSDELPSSSMSTSSRSKVTFLLVLSVFSTVFGSSSQFGFNLGVLNNIEESVRLSLSSSNHSSFVIGRSFSDVEWATAVSIFAIGGMIGSMIAGNIADLIGRKRTMLGNNVVAVVGVCLQSAAVHPLMLIVGRAVIGINAGANTVLAPLYISEVSPLKYRGTMGVFHQLAITLTILMSQLLGIHQVLGQSDIDGYYGWRILLAMPLLFVAAQLLTLPFCPESPKYLYIMKAKEREAKTALMKLSGDCNYQQDLIALQEEASRTVSTSFLTTLKEFVIRPGLRRAIFISIALHLSQQLTGIGSILLYSSDVFRDSGVNDGDIATAVVGLVLVIGTLFTVVLIERVGRRTLMLYGLGGMFVFYGLISAAICYQYAFYHNYTKYSPTGILLVVFTLSLTVSFALGPGAIPWLLVSELFQQTTRPTAVSIATITNWSSNFVVGFLFPFMLKHLSPYPFVTFIAVTGVFWLIMYVYLPETKNKTVDEITQYFRKVTSADDWITSSLCCCRRHSSDNRTASSSPIIIN